MQFALGLGGSFSLAPSWPARSIRVSRYAHNMTQHPPPSPFSKMSRAARVAASKTSSTPSPLRLEHSRYLRAPISCAAWSPCRSVTNFRLFLRISSTATGSSRRSFFRPTRMMGTSGHRSVASSIHYSLVSYSPSYLLLASTLHNNDS